MRLTITSLFCLVLFACRQEEDLSTTVSIANTAADTSFVIERKGFFHLLSPMKVRWKATGELDEAAELWLKIPNYKPQPFWLTYSLPKGSFALPMRSDDYYAPSVEVTYKHRANRQRGKLTLNLEVL